jgi:serine/threonine protein kinase
MAIKDPELLTEADFPIEFGRYMLTGLLGEGGMGRVFTATLRGGGGFEKQVAVKVVRSSALRQNGGLAEGLENEARIGALLTHPNIVATNDFDIVHGHPMIAMELMRGLSLDAVLASGAQLEAAHILDIGRQVAEGLSAAHEFEDGAEGVSLVHRDLNHPMFL